MRLRGRRHWTETVDVLSAVQVTSGPGTGGVASTSVLHSGITASVQPASNADVIRHGLETDSPVYWVRFAESPPVLGDYVVWQGDRYRVATVSSGQNIDTQLLVKLDSTDGS